MYAKLNLSAGHGFRLRERVGATATIAIPSISIPASLAADSYLTNYPAAHFTSRSRLLKSARASQPAIYAVGQSSSRSVVRHELWLLEPNSHIQLSAIHLERSTGVTLSPDTKWLAAPGGTSHRTKAALGRAGFGGNFDGSKHGILQSHSPSRTYDFIHTEAFR